MNLEIIESDNFALMYKILCEARSDIQKSTFIDWSKRRKNYLVNGDQGFVFIEDTNEIGYYISEKFRGYGLAEQAVKKMIKLNPRKYYFAKMKKENKSSIKVVEKLGFTVKGIVYGLDAQPFSESVK